MFTQLQNLLSRITLVWKYGGVVHSITTAMKNFPRLEDSELLRVWIRPLLSNAYTLATVTNTTIDDLIATAAVRIVDSNRAWSAIHALALLVRDGVMNPSIPQMRHDEGLDAIPLADCQPEGVLQGDMYEIARKIAQEVMPGNPSAVMAAIGLILFLLQRRYKNN